MTPPAPSGSAARAARAALSDDPGRALIGLDFDGTLAPIVAEPEAARAHPRAAAVLQRLAPYVGRIAVITGRPAEFVVGPGGLAGVPSLVVLGHYGLERWHGGRLSAPAMAAAVEDARRRLPDVLRELRAPPGTTVEDKGHALAVHVRQTESPPDVLHLLAEPIAALARATGLVVEPGRLVLELRLPGVDKGQALRSLVTEMAGKEPSRGLSAVVFAGDDLGDLPAFDEVARLRADGVPGLLICSGSEEVGAPAARADLVLDGPGGVVEWLEALAQQLEDPRRRG